MGIRDETKLEAEVSAAASQSIDLGADADLRHELQVHDLELRMQHEELLSAYEALSVSRDAYRELYEGAPVGYLTLDESGVCLVGNKVAASMLAVSPRGIENLVLPALMDREDADELHRHLQRVLADGRSESCELAVRTAPDVALRVRLDCIASSLADGRTIFRTIITDVTERWELARALGEANENLETRVEERTKELRLANEALEGSIRSRQRAEHELEHARRMEAIGRLAGGIAHDRWTSPH